MTLTLLDHVFVILIALVFPIIDFFSIRETAKKLRDGESGLRMAFYRGVIGYEWIYVLVVVAAWLSLGRGVAELGFVPSFSGLAWLGYALTAAMCGLLLVQARTILGSAKHRESMRREIGWMGSLMPHTLAERRGFDLVSITAGICEEILFRGFIMAYFMSLLGAPFWAAAIGSSILFGVAHMYQGPRGILKTGSVGLVMALLYGLTGSLWAPMLAHAVMDIVAGRIAFGSLREAAPEDSSPELAA